MSHIQPKNLAGYQDFFRQNSSVEQGWLLRRKDNSPDWEKCWVVLEDGVFSFYADRDDVVQDKCERISMDNVISWRTNVRVVTCANYLFSR